MNNFIDLIEHATVDELKLRIKSLPFTCSIPSRKAEVVNKLWAAITNPNNVQLIWESLSQVQQLALQEAVHNQDGYMDGFVFYAKYQKAHPSTKNWSGYRARENKNDVKLSPFFYPDRRYGSPTRIPDDLLLFLKSHIPQPPEFFLPTTTVDSEELVILETQQYTESELNTLINTIKDKKLKVSAKTGLPSKALLKNLSQQLNELYQDQSGDDESVKNIKAFGWIQILRAASWIKETAAGELQINVKKAPLQQRQCDTLKALLCDWQERSKFDEFSRITEVKGQKGKGQKYFTPAKSCREACIESLKHCPVGEWVAFDDFLRLMAVKDQYILVTYEPDYLYIIDSVYGQFYDGTFLTNAYSRCIIMEYFSTLGLVDIAYVAPENAQESYYDGWGAYELDYLSIYDGLKYLRLTKLGAYLLGIVDSYTDVTSTVKTSLTLLPKHRINFSHQPTPGEKIFLTNYADEIANNAWQLSTNKLLSHLENGGELADIQAFLAERDEQPYFPVEMEHLFNTLEQNKAAVMLEGNFILLKCKSELVAENIASAPTIKNWCHRVGKEQLIIPEGKESLFRQLIHELEYAMPIKS